MHTGAGLRHILVATLAASMLMGFARTAYAGPELLAGADGVEAVDAPAPDKLPVVDCLLDPNCPLLEPAETSGPVETSESGGAGGGLTAPSDTVTDQSPAL